jgi:predicted MFS family arabinose efflux permease
MKAAADSTAVGEWRSYWTLPIAAALGYFISVLHLYSVGPFVRPLQQEFGWSRAQISVGITIAGVVGAICSVFVGRLVDRVGPRIVALIGVPFMTSAFALLATATGDKANWFLLWCLVALGNVGLQATVWASAVASRFASSRGLSFAVMMSGGSLGASVHPILATWLISSYGWRAAFVAMGGIGVAIVFPFMFLFFRGAQDRSHATGLVPTKVSVLPGISVVQGLRSLAFYKLVVASTLFTFTTVGIIVHFVPILQDRGSSSVAAAATASLIGLSSIVGRVGVGLLLDRFLGHVVGSIVFCLPIIACALLLFSGSDRLSQVAAAACFGLTVGAEVDVMAYLASRHFGLKNFGVLFGVIVGALTIGVAFGPLAAGIVFDQYGSYAPFLAITMAFMATSSLILASLPRPPAIAMNLEKV